MRPSFSTSGRPNTRVPCPTRSHPSRRTIVLSVSSIARGASSTGCAVAADGGTVPSRPVITADAFWFGPKERRAFGWFHAPNKPSRAMGVIMCPPLGHEMLCTHRAYRHLAQRLAESGFPVLRFDYHGTGDSPGSDLDEDRVGAWIATIDDAIALMRESGAASIALFGMRAGGTLAAAA